MEFCNSRDDDSDLRRGPWTRDEDNLLNRYISCHGEGRWNLLAKRSGLKRTGKSCRLRWLNYLKPDIKRGNLTTEEQLLILKLHHKWGNRWSRIAQHLPGRTDNEIKNYWRTRVQKQARQLSIESNSKMYLDAICGYWIPRLLPTTEQDSTLQQMRTHPSITSTSNLADTTALSSHSMISIESSSTGLTSSISKGNNTHNYGVDRHELGTGSDGNNPSNQQDFDESYLDEFDAGYYYNEDEFSAVSLIGACDTSPSGFQVDGEAEGFWGVDVDVDDDIWQLRNSETWDFKNGWLGPVVKEEFTKPTIHEQF